MLVAILVPLTFFAMIFGVVYVTVTARNRERLSLIEKGADPKLFESEKRASTGTILKWGMLMVGVGLGILLANILVNMGLDEVASYFSMIFLCGGAGLLAAYRMEQKALKNKADNV
ncbi:MAG: hypothetical protein LWW85_15370 [Marinilabiliales bacterium]|nr:hypothetical protein [Marinilabiliales bacterium]